MSISKTGCSSSITKADLESSYKQGFADCAKILADDYNQALSDLWKLVTSKYDDVMDLQDLSECIEELKKGGNKNDRRNKHTRKRNRGYKSDTYRNRSRYRKS